MTPAIAGLLGIGQDDLLRRERRRQRRILLGITAMALFFAGVAAVAVFQTLEANAQRRTAEANAERAEQALGRLFVQRASDPTATPGARARYALAGLQLFPREAQALRVGLGAVLEDQGRLLRTFTSSGAPAQFLEDGHGLILRGRDKQLAEWDLETGQRTRIVVDSIGEVRDMAVSAEGSLLGLAEGDGMVRVMDRAMGREIWHGRVGVGQIWSITLVAGEMGTAEIRNARTGDLAFTLRPDRMALYKIAFSADSQFVATASHTGEAQVWRVQDGALTFRLAGHRDRLRAAVFLGSGMRLATASMDNTIRIWAADSGTLLRTLDGHANWVDTLATDRTGETLVSGSSDGTARIWNAQTGVPMATLPRFDGPVYGVAISPDGTRVAAASADGTALLADAKTGSILSRLRAHEGGPVYSVAFSADGKQLYTQGAVEALRVWNAHDELAGAAASEPGPLERRTVQSKVDRGQVFVDDAGKVQIIDVATKRVVRTLEGHLSKVNHVAVSSDGDMVATASLDNTARILRRDGRAVSILRGHVFPLELIALSRDDRLAVTASRDETVRLWDVQSGRELLKWPAVRWMDSLGFSVNGDTVLGSGEGRSFAWDISRLAWPAAQSVMFACEQLLAPSQHQFTVEERENDVLVRDVWLPRRRGQSAAVCPP
ncbi:WD40 repeat domain-containing protein [Variovorax sp. GT1P44]|uniref:WD40 repeat domain-containing protein n=1 Tax=Variovorax sp. GT1P44 TaxID=3443742 RepID=UPI003F47C21D